MEKRGQKREQQKKSRKRDKEQGKIIDECEKIKGGDNKIDEENKEEKEDVEKKEKKHGKVCRLGGREKRCAGED